MKKWVVKNKLDRNLNICENNLISNLLYSRGIRNKVDAVEFLNPSIDKLYNPFGLKDMDRAVERIDCAIKACEKIIIYGDYDVDGITSTSILYRAFKRLGVDVGYYIPDRMNEGYGINMEAIDYLKTIAADVIITVDCGIASMNEVAYAKELGMDVIITDHHECQEKIPDTIVINPKRKDCTYPFKYLSGCGVAFKLVQALWMHYGLTGFEDYLDLAAIGTIADVVTLVSENRIIAKNGLKMLQESDKCGIKAIINVAGIKGEISSYNVAFQLAPRINAVGRLSNAKIAVELFTTNDYDKALQIAKFLDQENKRRQDIEEEILNEAIFEIENQEIIKYSRVIVLSSPKWHIGVVGIVASKIVEKYNRPAILICEDKVYGRGSGRSIEGFNLFESLNMCSFLLLKYGGHEMAAGLSINIDKISEFRKEINKIAEVLPSNIFEEKLYLDLNINTEDLNIEMAEKIETLQPFGVGNPSPIFKLDDIHVESKRIIGDKHNHLKIVLEKNDMKYDAIYFNGIKNKSIEDFENIDAIFNTSINEWKNTRTLQLMIKDIRPCIKLIYSSISDNYFKNTRYAISPIDEQYDFKNVNFIKKDISFLKDFLFLKKGYVFMSSYKSVREIEYLFDSVDISFSKNLGSQTQIIICPRVDEIDFCNNNVLIYDFLPGQFEYKVLSEKVNGNIINFSYSNIKDSIIEYMNDIIIGEDIINKFINDLKISDITGSVQNIAVRYNIDSYKTYNMIITLKEMKAIEILIKNNILKIRIKDKLFSSDGFITNQTLLTKKLNNLEHTLEIFMKEEKI